MSEPLQMIRKVQMARAADFDDQLWPINCTILILAGFVAGIVIAQSDFSEPRLLYNGWVHLASVGLMVGLLFLGVWLLQGRMLRRLQLAILLSLLLHVWLMYDLHQRYLVLKARPIETAPRVTDPFNPAEVPKFHLVMPEPAPQPQPRESFEEPVPTQLPPESEPQPSQPEPFEQPTLAIEKPPVEPEPLARQEVSPLELRRAELSAPRRADLAAGRQISRQPWKDRPLPGPPVPAPELQPAAPQATAAPSEQLTAMGRRVSEPPPFERRTFREPRSTQPRKVVRMARRASEAEPLPDVPTTPTPTRQLELASEVPRTEARAPEPEQTVAQARPVEPQPSLEAAPRRVSQAPTAPQWAAEPKPRVTSVPRTLAATAPRVEREAEPELARQDQQRPSRAWRRPALPSIAAEAQAPAAAASPAAALEAPPAVAQAKRRQTPPALSAVGPEVPPSGRPGPASPAAPRRTRPPTEQPVVASPTTLPRRAEVALAALPEQALSGQAPEPGGPPKPSGTSAPGALEPAVGSVAKAGSGAAEMLTPSQAGRAVAPMTELAQLPETPARRAQSRQGPEEVDLGASRPSTIQRAQRGAAALPSTVIAADIETTRPAQAGSPTPSRLAPSAAAAVAGRAEARAPAAERPAAAGRAELALGSAQLPSRLGQPRGTGRSEPAAIPRGDVPRVARANRGLSLALAPIAQQAAEAGAATGIEPATGLASPAPSAQASATTRQGRPVLPVERPAPGSGAEGASGTAPRVTVAQLTRVTRHESDNPTGLSGGGARRPAPARAAIGPNIVAQAKAEEPAGLSSPGRGSKPGSPLEAGPLAGLDRQVGGLPGSLVALPAAGSLAATSTGRQRPLPEALARRATAGQQGGEGTDLAPARPSTLARSSRGAELPTIAEAVELSPGRGAGGVAQSPGAASSSLEPAEMASLRRGGASKAPAERPVPAGLSQLGRGTAGRTVLAGVLPAGREQLPTLAAGADVKPIGRTAGGPGLEDLVQATAQEPGGQGPAAGGAAPASGGGALAETPRVQVGRTGGAGLTELGPGRIGVPGGRGSARAARPRLARTGKDEVALLAQGGAVPSAVPMMSRSPAARLPGKAAELVAEGPLAGQPTAPPEGILQTAEVAAERQWAGLPGELNQQVAVDLASVAGPTATTPGTVAGPRRLPEGMDEQPTLAAETGGAVVGKTNRPGLPRGIAERAEPQPPPGLPAEHAVAFSEPSEALQVGTLGRREGGLPVQVAALSGPGGLSLEPSPEVGIPSRRARPESDVVHTVSSRFVVRRSGGELSIDAAVREPTEPYRQRNPAQRGERALRFGGSEGTEAAVEAGLDFFARMQFPDGHWSLDQMPPGVQVPKAKLGQMRSDTAATGLALLAYLGAGYTHLGDKHRDVVRRGLDWLVRTQDPETGELFAMADGSKPTAVTRFYGHGIAAIALCEAYGMTQDPELREPARKAVQYILDTQHPTRGGWRYYVDPRTGRSTESDTSVTGWMLMALKSAQMAGLDVPKEAFDKIDHWLELAHFQDEEGKYVYNPYALDTPEQRHGRLPSRAMTAEAMLMAIYLERKPDDARLLRGAEYLKANLPEVGTEKQPLRDCYYWYYATQAMFQMQGDYWQAWNERLRPLLRASQIQRGPLAGSWDPLAPVEDRWGKSGGRLYVTSLHLLMLEVYYRHLPLFKELTR